MIEVSDCYSPHSRTIRSAAENARWITRSYPTESRGGNCQGTLVLSVYRLLGWRFGAQACLASCPLGRSCFQAQVSLQLARDGLEASAH